MDFSIPQHIQDIARRVHHFVDEVVLPVEQAHIRGGQDVTPEEVIALREQARAAGLFAPTMPRKLGGMGLDIQEIVPVFEAAGRSMLGPLAIHCAAPDEGNMHLLHLYANEEQTERYLRPLVEEIGRAHV